MTIRLGITGGIGSGKSSVSGLLRVMGVPVYDCDREARRLMNAHAGIRQGLTALAGGAVYGEDGCLNRPFLARFMFGNADRVAAVNALVHPAVREDFRQWADRQPHEPLVAVESAILFEAGMRADVDAVALVYTPLSERVQRTIGRDRVSEADVQARLASQMADEEKIPLADFIIHNAEADAITPQVMQIIQQLTTNKQLC